MGRKESCVGIEKVEVEREGRYAEERRGLWYQKQAFAPSEEPLLSYRRYDVVLKEGVGCCVVEEEEELC